MIFNHPDFPDHFPLDALRGLMRRAVLQHAQNQKVVIGTVGTAALASVLASIQGGFDVQRHGLPPSALGGLFVVIDDSGGGKDTGMRPFVAPFHALQQELDVQSCMAAADRTAKFDMWTVQHRLLLNEVAREIESGRSTACVEERLRQHIAARPSALGRLQLIHADATEQGLKSAIANGSKSLLIFTTEAREFLDRCFGKNSTFMNLAYDGTATTRTRADGVDVINDYRISALFGIQPAIFLAYLEAHQRHALESGALARLLITRPPSSPGTRTRDSNEKFDESEVQQLQGRLTELLHTTVIHRQRSQAENAQRGRQSVNRERAVIGFDAEGARRFDDFFNLMQSHTRPGQPLELLRAHAAKAANTRLESPAACTSSKGSRAQSMPTRWSAQDGWCSFTWVKRAKFCCRTRRKQQLVVKQRR